MIRVTEPLNYFSEPWKLDWYAKNGKAHCNRVSKQAMKIGSRVDEIIKSCPIHSDTWDKEWFSKKNSNDVHNCMSAFAKWEAVYKPKSISNGARLYGNMFGLEITGEPDLYVDDVLVDIKCSSKISLSYWVQVNMYVMLRGITSKVAILCLDKQTASYEYVVKDYDKSLVDVWVGLCRAYVYYKGDDDGGFDIQEV